MSKELNIDLFEDLDPVSDDEWMAIASLKYDVGGEALIRLLEGRIRGAMSQLIVVNPNDIGGVAQLQARINEAGSLRDFLKLEPEVVEAQRKLAEMEEVDNG